MSNLDALLSELSSVIMTKTTKGGLTESEITREYRDLCGKRVEYALHGYRSLGDLLRNFPQKFTSTGGRWFGKITQENEDIIRSMASEKPKRGRGMPRFRFPVQGDRSFSRSTGGPSQAFHPPGDFSRRNAPLRFHESASDGVLKDFDNSQGISFNGREDGPIPFTTGGGWREKAPARVGFGNKSFNYIPSESGSTRSSSRSASIDASRDADNDMSPPGLDSHHRNPDESEKCSEYRPEPFRDMVSNTTKVIPDNLPGLPVNGTNDKPPASTYIYPPHYESFRGMVANNIEAPEYPPGLEVNVPKDESADSPLPVPRCDSSRDVVSSDSEMYPAGLRLQDSRNEPSGHIATKQTCDVEVELSDTQRIYLDVAQKTYDLLKQANIGMTVKEISEKIELPVTNLEINARAHVGVAVRAHSETFSLSSMNSGGTVEILRGAPRPGIGKYIKGKMLDRNSGKVRTPSVSSSRPSEHSSDIIYKAPTRDSDKKDYVDDRHRYGRDDEGKLHCTKNDLDELWGAEVHDGGFGSSRFSVPTSSGFRGQSDMYDNHKAEEKFAPPPTVGFSAHNSYNSRENLNSRDYWNRDEVRRGRADRDEEQENYPSFEQWKKISRDDGADCEFSRATSTSYTDSRHPTEYSRYPDEFDSEPHHRRRFSASLEPKKFECKHKYFMNSTEVPRYESVRLTHFVALDQFYVRSCSDENRYHNMLVQLRDDYIGALEDAVPQVWMKGDGAAVRYERRWQRAVVCTPVNSFTVTNVDVFLIDVGKTVTVSSEQMVPLHEYYHTPPFAFCCTIGYFDIVPGRRKDLLDECDRMASCFKETENDDDLEIQSIERFYDETEKLKVRLIYRYRDSGRPKDVLIPRYFVDEELITLR